MEIELSMIFNYMGSGLAIGALLFLILFSVFNKDVEPSLLKAVPVMGAILILICINAYGIDLPIISNFAEAWEKTNKTLK